jgi:hypothetical protein
MRRRYPLAAALLATAALIGPAQATPEEWPQIGMLLNTRYSCGATADRVVLDISGPMPGYSVTHVSRLYYDGSGAPVPLAGGAFVSAQLSTAVAHVPDGNNAGLNVYSGPRLTSVGCTRLKGLAFTGDYEAQVGVGIATDRRRSLTVFTLTSPNRLVIDIR